MRRWLPQLAKLPVEYIHCPWEAPFSLRASSKLVIGTGPNGYPPRVITDLEAARRASHDAVMAVRNSAVGRRHVLPSGHEWRELEDGRKVTLITRVDFREGKIETRQTAEAKWDVRRREKGDLLSVAMRDAVREHENL